MSVTLERPTAFDDVVHDVHLERLRQEAKWGTQNHSDERWMTILTEEVGESAEAVLDLNITMDDRLRNCTGEREHLREELVQVAAVASAWIEALDRRL